MILATLFVLCFPPILAAAPAAPVRPQGGPPEPYLTQLHMHGSLSEGSASMKHHTEQAEQAGYDVIWWTDHMERQFASLYLHRMGFEGTLREFRENGALNEFVVEEDSPGFVQLSYTSSNPAAGSEAARLRSVADPGADWTEGRLVYGSVGNLHRKSLFAEPELRLATRLREQAADAGFLVRVTLSANPDGLTEPGLPNLLEYLPAGMVAPPPEANVVRVELPALPLDQWQTLVLRPAVEARLHFPEGDDQSLHAVALVLVARDGAALEIDLDDYGLTLDGFTDLDLFRESESVLGSRYSKKVTHHVGMEIAGPYEVMQPIQKFSTRDHLLALYPAAIPALIDFHDPVNQFDYYPKSGVELVHQAGGVAVVAHIYGSRMICCQQERRDALFLARRLVRQKAFGADAMEVGYPRRERELADHLAAWDALSYYRNYITGIGTSDNHNVLPWDLVENRWGSWIQASRDDAPSLLDAIRRGKVFFGDPSVFDPKGDVTFEASGGSYSMGNVVPTAAGSVSLRARVEGARAGDDLVALRNGREVHREAFPDRVLDTTFTVDVIPGDFVRLSVHDPSDQPYLISNPIYFIEEGTAPPPNRAPGS